MSQSAAADSQKAPTTSPPGSDVDPRLPADGGVHHREQGRRHADEVDAPEPGRGDETRQLDRRPLTETDHRVIPD